MILLGPVTDRETFYEYIKTLSLKNKGRQRPKLPPKYYLTRVLKLHIVTRLAILGYTESSRPIVTGTAGFAVLHVLHGCLIRSAHGLIQVGMTTVATLKHLNVYGVREGDVPGVLVLEENVPCMAFSAVSGNAESMLAIMADAAGLAALHYFHTDVVAVVFLYKGFRVTLIAAAAMINNFFHVAAVVFLYIEFRVTPIAFAGM